MIPPPPQQDRPKYGYAAREPPAPKKDCVWVCKSWLGTVNGRRCPFFIVPSGKLT